MKKVTCPRCGNKEAADFVFRILCPEEACDFYDAKLAKERASEGLSWIDELAEADYNDGLDNLYGDVDFISGPGYVLDLSDLIDYD